jgi:hypothetical protein
MSKSKNEKSNQNRYKFTLTSDIYHEATKRNKTANVEVLETKEGRMGYLYNIQITPTYSIRRKSYHKSSFWKKDAKKLAEEYWQKYLNE